MCGNISLGRLVPQAVAVGTARRRSGTLLVLVLSVLAGLLAMHALTVGAFAAQPPSLASGPMAGMAVQPTTPPTRPAPPDGEHPHHGPGASGHHTCLAALTAAVPAIAPPSSAPSTAAAVQPAARTSRPAHAPATRAPPDLDVLCVSRT